MPKPPDKVQINKQESVAGGGDPLDNDELFETAPLQPWEDAPEVQGLYFQPTNSGINDEDVYITRDLSGNMLFRDQVVGAEASLTTLLASGTGITDTEHKALRHLIHFIEEGPGDGFASGAFKETTYTSVIFPVSVVWYESASKTQKIVEKTITRTGGSATLLKPTPIVWKMYDEDGTTVLATIQDDITYSGVFEVNRTRTIS